MIKPRRFMLVLACLLLLALPPAAAHAWSYIDHYKQGTNRVGEVFGTWDGGEGPAYASRSWNRTWHSQGYYWNLFYCPTSGTCFGGNTDALNPTYASGGAVYAKSLCHNMDDNSGVTWTCETTVP